MLRRRISRRSTVELKKLVEAERIRQEKIAAACGRSAAELRPQAKGTRFERCRSTRASWERLIQRPSPSPRSTLACRTCGVGRRLPASIARACASTRYAQIGISLPRTSREQFHAGAYIPPNRLDLLEPGDLVFFGYNGDPDQIHHVGMYVGGGDFIQAPSAGDVVRISSLTGRIESKGDYVGAARP